MSLKINLNVIALRFLSRRDYSYNELFNKLTKYTDNHDEITKILNSLVSQKFLDDERFITNFIEYKSRKYGSAAIKYRLNQKVNNPELVNQIYQQQQIDELSNAREVWRKKFGNLPQDNAQRAQQIRFLQNRGFSFSIIKQIINSLATDYEYP